MRVFHLAIVYLLVIFFVQSAAAKYPAKVVIIGIDGASLNIVEPYAQKGVIPNIAKLMQEGTRGHLESYWPTRTPQVWTSAVTGKLPGQHGIWDHKTDTAFNPPNVRTQTSHVVTSNDRKSKALWNILDQYGVRSLTVGWVISWPAEPLKHGIMIAPKELLGDKRQTTIKGSFYRDVKNFVQPSSLEPQATKLIVEASDISDTEITYFADVPRDHSPIYQLPYLKRYMYTFKWSLARARSVEALTLNFVDQAKAEVVLAYFQCTDTMGHRFWIFKEPLWYVEQRLKDLGLPTWHISELQRRFGRAFEQCYIDTDARIGRILDAVRGPDTLVLLLSDHGFGHVERPHPFKSEPYGGVHLDQGIIVANGPGINAAKILNDVSILDITPTVLFYLGLPTAKDMRGKIAKTLFTPAFLAKQQIKSIPSYESTPQNDCPYSQGYPPRKIPLKPTADQMNGRNPYFSKPN
ncbi:MAG: alkaline phosphatase family protein [Deltaproteobacteria bacterium]|nr:alkaline phosphatase family protein [Deltaproteobacteria bacterium]